jgi:hypothetical protein
MHLERLCEWGRFFPDSQGNIDFLGIGLEKTDMCDKRWWQKYVRLYNRRQNFSKENANSM